MNAPGQTSLVNGTGYPYRYILPKNFSPTTKYPVIIFLHGVGEDGTDGVLPLAANNNSANGALALVSTANPDNQTNFPCFFIVPQVPLKTLWSSDAAATQIQKLLTIFQTQYPGSFDTNRIYITGLSEGGTGSYDLPYLMAQSNHLGFNPFAAAVPMSASWGLYISHPYNTQPTIPMWAFHAANDADAAVSLDDTAVSSFRNLGLSVLYTRYNTGMHGIWEVAYQQPQLLPWMFSQTLNQTAQAPLSGFAITAATAPVSGVMSLSGVTTTAEAFSTITWANSTSSSSGTATGVNPTWSISNIPISGGTNHIQVTASAPNSSAVVFGTNTSYGGSLTVNLPFFQSLTTNLALNAPVTVSSQESSLYPGAAAVDGDTTTRWSSAWADPQWLQIDLGAAYDLSEVDIDWETACGSNYQIQTSVDGVTWNTASTVTGNTTSGWLSYRYSNVAPPSGRYVRIYGTARATQWGYSIIEVNVFAQSTTVSQTSDLSNVALNKSVLASSTENATNVASNAVDGTANTRWSSLYSDPQWIEVDLGGNYDISEVDLNWEGACGKNYQIQTSMDNVIWTTQNNVINNTQTGLLTYPYAAPVTARYVRMYGTARATQYGYSLWEFAVYGEPSTTVTQTLVNVALNQPVTVSSIESAALGGQFAVDGNPDTRWGSAWADPQWIQVDLGESYNISEVDLNWEGACGKNYLIQTSLDGVNWTTQSTVTGNTKAGVLTYSYASTTPTARYVRMYGTARATQYGYSLYEFVVLADPTTGSTTNLMSNLALNAPVTVSSIESASYPGSAAVDGNTATRWSSGWTDPQWIEVDLGAIHNISEVDLNWEGACGRDYQIQTSTDNINWTTQTTVTGNSTTGLIPYSYSTPISARYVRMYGTARATQYGYSLYEFSVIGQ